MIEQLTVPQLRALLSEMGLSTRGSKAKLVDRVESADRDLREDAWRRLRSRIEIKRSVAKYGFWWPSGQTANPHRLSVSQSRKDLSGDNVGGEGFWRALKRAFERSGG